MVRRRKQNPIVAVMGDTFRRWIEQLHTDAGEPMTYTDVATALELEGDRPQERVGAWVRGTNTIPTLCIWQIWRKQGLSPNALFGIEDKELSPDERFVVEQLRIVKRSGWQAGVEAIKSVASAQASVSRRLTTTRKNAISASAGERLPLLPSSAVSTTTIGRDVGRDAGSDANVAILSPSLLRC